MPGVASRRCHLTLSATVWRAIAAQAAARDIPVSLLVDGLLRHALGLHGHPPLGVEDTGAVSGARERRRCRLSIESAVWERLAEAAAAHGVSVPAWIRQRLRAAVVEIDALGAAPLTRGAPAIGSTHPDGHHDRAGSPPRATQGVAMCEF